MFSTFDEILEHVRKAGRKKTIAVAAAQDHEVLESAAEARKRGIAEFILVGDRGKISGILGELGENLASWSVVDEADEHKAAQKAMAMVASGEADIPMKGLLHTATFMRAAFNKELGLVAEKAVVSCITIAEYPAEKRLILVTDPAINVAPDYETKIRLIANAVGLAGKLGIADPKVAAIAAVETVNPSMPETVEAAMLCKAAERGQIKGCRIEGPLALDNAVSELAAEVKGIAGPVAGRADILLMPNLLAGNVLDKSLRYFGGLKTGSYIAGAKVPLVATSRSDSAANKIHAIALSVL